MEQKLQTKITLYVKFVWMTWATRPAIPATCQPIFDENTGLPQFLEVSVDAEKKAKAQINLLISVTEALLP
jgi:hypothetical protein